MKRWLFRGAPPRERPPRHLQPDRPALHLGRLRARGEMNEIRTEQLAFSEEEAECLLNEKTGLDIGADDLSILLERTEGWPAGIYLALTLAEQGGQARLHRVFQGLQPLHSWSVGRGGSGEPHRGSEAVSTQDLGPEDDDGSALRCGDG